MFILDIYLRKWKIAVEELAHIERKSEFKILNFKKLTVN